MTDEKIFRLAKPRRKGLLPILFSRFLIIALLLIFQVLLMVGFYGWLAHYIPFYSGFLAIFTLLMIVYLFNSEMDSSAKLTWMFMMALVPLPAAIFLFFIKTNAGHRKIRQREKQIIAECKNMISQPENVICELEGDYSGTEDLAAYMNRSGCFPIFDKTQVTYFPIGERKLAAIFVPEDATGYVMPSRVCSCKGICK